ncbi:MAG: inorganic phosphate transporter [Eubacteriales bacterium]|jgi:PiT family inorganic phosphate transporter
MIYYLTLAALVAVIFVNGWTDAPNAIATTVGSRAMKPGSAVAMAAFFNLAGAMSVCFAGGRVAHSVFEIAHFGSGAEALRALFAGLVAVAAWAVFAWYFGIPTSESHALLSGLAGSAASVTGAASFNVTQWSRVGLGLVLTTLPAFLLGRAVFAVITLACRNRDRREVTPFFAGAQRFGAAAGAYLHGLQDGQKFMGAILICSSLAGSAWDGERIPLRVAFFCAAFMAAGTALGGSRIIKRVALDMVRLDAPRGFAADLSAALCLAGCTALGLPVSTTHAKTCAVMGAGSAKQRGGLELRSVCDIIIAWLLTFPVCFFLGWGAAEISELFGGLS